MTAMYAYTGHLVSMVYLIYYCKPLENWHNGENEYKNKDAKYKGIAMGGPGWWPAPVSQAHPIQGQNSINFEAQEPWPLSFQNTN